jgi:DNA-binding NarL/FixJ family response regulator
MPIRVFLADDHAVVRDGLRLLLETKGDIAIVGEATDGFETVKKVEQLKPDVVIMDITMQGLNGIDATQHICKTCPSTKVVILSMHATTEYIYRAFKAGAKGYLLKESAGIEVVKAVRTVHIGRRYLSQQITETVIDDYIIQHKDSRDRSPLKNLSFREKEILKMVVEGKSSADIAKTLFLSPKTVDTYRSRLMRKLDVYDIPSLVKFAIQHGITPLK